MPDRSVAIGGRLTAASSRGGPGRAMRDTVKVTAVVLDDGMTALAFINNHSKHTITATWENTRCHDLLIQDDA